MRTVCLRKMMQEIEEEGLDVDLDGIDPVRSIVLPEDTTEKEQAIYLTREHVTGKTEWAAFNQAGHIYDLSEKYGYTQEDIASGVGIGKAKVGRVKKAYEQTLEYKERYEDDNWINKYSYFYELQKKKYTKNKKNPLPEGWIDHNFDKFMEWIHNGQIERGEHQDSKESKVESNDCSLLIDEEENLSSVQPNPETQVDFANPSSIDPAKTSEFCSHLDLGRERKIVLETYEKPEKHFKYPIEALLRLIPFQRLRQIKHQTNLASQLKQNGQAEDLGFKKKVPSRRTINRFFRDRLGLRGMVRLRKSLLFRFRQETRNKGLKMGRRISVDSTPLETLQNDSIGRINRYYFQKYGIGSMIKVHFATCVDTGIPLSFLLTDANAYDGHFLAPLLLKIRRLGIDFEEVYGDAHYGTLKNYARVPILFGAKPYFQLEKNAKMRKDGLEENIRKQYRKLRTLMETKEGRYKPPEEVSMEDQCSALFRYGRKEMVGAYFRNRWLKVRRNDPAEYERIYHRRNASEGLHGILKDQLMIDKNLNVKGFKDIEFYIEQFLITLLFVALTRVKNGISEGLAKINPTAFS